MRKRRPFSASEIDPGDDDVAPEDGRGRRIPAEKRPDGGEVLGLDQRDLAPAVVRVVVANEPLTRDRLDGGHGCQARASGGPHADPGDAARLRQCRKEVGERAFRHFAAMQAISTSIRGSASFASTVARAGRLFGSIHAFHTPFIASRLRMSVTQTFADRIFALLEPALASVASIAASTCLVCPAMSWRQVVGDGAGDEDETAVLDGVGEDAAVRVVSDDAHARLLRGSR